jgi:hypothetical protein
MRYHVILSALESQLVRSLVQRRSMDACHSTGTLPRHRKPEQDFSNECAMQDTKVYESSDGISSPSRGSETLIFVLSKDPHSKMSKVLSYGGRIKRPCKANQLSFSSFKKIQVPKIFSNASPKLQQRNGASRIWFARGPTTWLQKDRHIRYACRLSECYVPHHYCAGLLSSIHMQGYFLRV